MVQTKINLEFLIQERACSEGILFYKQHNQPSDLYECINICLKENTLESLRYANWLMIHCLDDKLIEYSLFASEIIYPYYKKRNADDDIYLKLIKKISAYAKDKDEKRLRSISTYSKRIGMMCAAFYSAHVCEAKENKILARHCASQSVQYALDFMNSNLNNRRIDVFRKIILNGLELAGYKERILA